MFFVMKGDEVKFDYKNYKYSVDQMTRRVLNFH